jgi:hypothetical protein
MNLAAMNLHAQVGRDPFRFGRDRAIEDTDQTRIPGAGCRLSNRWLAKVPDAVTRSSSNVTSVKYEEADLNADDAPI